MVDYAYFGLFNDGSVDKQWRIEYEGGVILNDDLFSQSIEISESLCSEKELKFGSCESSVLKFKVANIVKPLIGLWLTVSVSLNHHDDEPLMIGRYKVESDKPTADRMHREVVAYDALHDIINADVAAWYNAVLPYKESTVTMRMLRESFVWFFGLTEVVPDGGLVNDGMIVERTIDPEQISGKDVITAICEINGCFGRIGRDGKFHYIYLAQAIRGLYPANNIYPSKDIYPMNPKTSKIETGSYIKCTYEDFITGEITKLQIRKEENDIGAVHGTGSNCYIIENNFLVYGKSSVELEEIASNIYGRIAYISYRPFNCDAVGNPCFEVGDAVRLQTRYDIVETYILQRTLKGVQALRDDYKSTGSVEYPEKSNSVRKSIIELKGKTNILERNVDETRSELRDAENQLSSRISQTVKSISMSVKNDATGKTASVELELTDDGGTKHTVTADKIEFKGLVAFSNLENDGETVINGSNIKTGRLVSLEIDNGNRTFHVDKYGHVTASSMTATGSIMGLNGYSIRATGSPQYLGKPPVEITPTHDFVFADARIGDNSLQPYLQIKGPSGTVMMECGEIMYDAVPNFEKPAFKESPIFNNGLYAKKAVIASLYQDFKQFDPFSNGSEIVDLKVRRSGEFVCVYGAYHAFTHPAGESKEIIIGNGSEPYMPKHHSVRASGYYGKRAFVFVIDESGKFIARNASSSDINIVATKDDPSPSPTDIQFRFDFFRF